MAFARTGDPNHPGLPTWPAYDDARRATMIFNTTSRVGDDPNGIIYDPRTKRVFSADRGSKRLTAIDAKTGKELWACDGLGDEVYSSPVISAEGIVVELVVA